VYFVSGPRFSTSSFYLDLKPPAVDMFLGAFAKLREAAIGFSYLSVCPSAPTGRILMKRYVFFSENLSRRNSSFFKIRQELYMKTFSHL
jgi:hypothetical protein